MASLFAGLAPLFSGLIFGLDLLLHYGVLMKFVKELLGSWVGASIMKLSIIQLASVGSGWITLTLGVFHVVSITM